MYRTINYLSKEQGYTFVEAMFQLLIFLLYSQLVFVILIYEAQQLNIQPQHAMLDWELFVSELNTYLITTESFTLTESSVEMTEIMPEINDKKYILNSSDNHIRLTTLTNGTIIMLPYAKIHSIQRQNHYFQLKVEEKSGILRERTFVVPLR